MPFGVSWPTYIKMWTVSIIGYACGSQLVHSYYKPLDTVDELIFQEANKMRAELGLKKPSFEEKFKKVVEQDKEYIEKFNLESVYGKKE